MPMLDTSVQSFSLCVLQKIVSCGRCVDRDFAERWRLVVRRKRHSWSFVRRSRRTGRTGGGTSQECFNKCAKQNNFTALISGFLRALNFDKKKQEEKKILTGQLCDCAWMSWSVSSLAAKRTRRLCYPREALRDRSSRRRVRSVSEALGASIRYVTLKLENV